MHRRTPCASLGEPRAPTWDALALDDLPQQRRSPSADAPAIRYLPQGNGQRGPGWPEGLGYGSCPSQPSAAIAHQRMSSSLLSPPRSAPTRSVDKPVALDSVLKKRSDNVESYQRFETLQEAFDRAMRGLGGARGALQDVVKHINAEAHKKSAEAWRMHRLEEAMTSSLAELNREVRALRADGARLRATEASQ